MNNKQVLQTLLCLCLALLASSFLIAQTKVWGHQAPTGQAAGEFQTAFVQSTTAGAYAITQWTALSISDSNRFRVPGAAFWTQTTLGQSQGAYQSPIQLSSTTFANGAAIFDSDYLDNAGVVGAFGTGASPAAQRGALISPRIDLSAVADSALVLSFHSFYRFFDLEELSVALSKDDGVTWEDSFDIAALQPVVQNTSIQGRLRILLDSFAVGGGSLAQCRLKFTFEGEYYFVMIDDVTLEIAPAYDMAIGHANPTASALEGQGNIIRIGSNAYQSYGNIDFYNPPSWFWGAKVVNYGGKPILPSQRPRLYCGVEITDLNSGITSVTNFLDSIVYTDTLFPKEEVVLKKSLHNNTMIFEQNISREYTIKYWTAWDGVEPITQNDSIAYSFIVNEEQVNFQNWRYEDEYISKASIANGDGRVMASDAFFPAGGKYQSIEYGSVYYFPMGQIDEMIIDSVDFRYYLSNGFSGAANQTIFANIYEYRDGTSGGLADGKIQNSELIMIGISIDSILGLGTTLQRGAYHLFTFSNFIDASTGTPSNKLPSNGFYYISIEIFPYLVGGVTNFGENDVPIFGIDRINYALNASQTTSAVPDIPAHLRLLDTLVPFVHKREISGLAMVNKVPSIGVFYSKPRYLISTQLSNALQANLSLFPNPASTILQVSTNLKQETRASYIITEETGRVVYYSTPPQGGAPVSIPIQHLAAGAYFLTIQTSEGSQTAAFVKE